MAVLSQPTADLRAEEYPVFLLNFCLGPVSSPRFKRKTAATHRWKNSGFIVGRVKVKREGEEGRSLKHPVKISGRTEARKDLREREREELALQSLKREPQNRVLLLPGNENMSKYHGFLQHIWSDFSTKRSNFATEGKFQ